MSTTLLYSPCTLSFKKKQEVFDVVIRNYTNDNPIQFICDTELDIQTYQNISKQIPHKYIQFIELKNLDDSTLQNVSQIIEINDPLPKQSLLIQYRKRFNLTRYMIDNTFIHTITQFIENKLPIVNLITPNILKVLDCVEPENYSLLRTFYPKSKIEYITYPSVYIDSTIVPVRYENQELNIVITDSNEHISNNNMVSLLGVVDYLKENPDKINTIYVLNCLNNVISMKRIIQYVWDKTKGDLLKKIKFVGNYTIHDLIQRKISNVLCVSHSKWFGNDYDLHVAHSYGIPIIHNNKTMKDIGYYYPEHDIPSMKKHITAAYTNYPNIRPTVSDIKCVIDWKPIPTTFSYRKKYHNKDSHFIQLTNGVTYVELGKFTNTDNITYDSNNLDIDSSYSHYFVHPFAGFIKNNKDETNFINLWMGNHILTHYWNLKQNGYQVGLSDVPIKDKVNIIPFTYYISNKNKSFWKLLLSNSDTKFYIILAEFSNHHTLPNLQNVTYIRQNNSLIETLHNNNCFAPLFDLNIQPKKHQTSQLKTIGYFGTKENCNKFLFSETFKEFCNKIGVDFLFSDTPNDWTTLISKCDAIIAIRPDWNNRYDSKPASKLINAIRNGIPFIGGKESAYMYEKSRWGSDGDCIILVDNPEDLLNGIMNLKHDYYKYKRFVNKIRLHYTNSALAQQVAKELQIQESSGDIPHILHHTYSDFNKLHPVIQQHSLNIKQICEQNGWQYNFYDTEQRETIIRDNFDANIYKAYIMINPQYGPAQADFFRYCLMYLYGGVYTDIKSEFKINIIDTLDLDNYDIFLSHWSKKIFNIGENNPDFGPNGEICNWILISKPKQQFWMDLLKYITNLIHNYDNKLVGKSGVLRLTGPIMFTYFIKQYQNKHNIYIYPRSDNLNYGCFDAVLPYLPQLRISNAKENSQYFQNHYSKLKTPIVNNQ